MLRLTGGEPWAVRGERASGGRFVLFGSAFSAEAGTLPTTAALIPLLDRALGAWSARPSSYPDVAPADGLQLPGEASVVVRPDSSRDTVSVGELYRTASEPGVYRVLDANGRQIWAFVINTMPVESDLAPMTTRRLRSAFDGWNIELADSPSEWLRDIYHERLGRELWWPLLLALLLLLLVESGVAAAGRASRAAAPQDSLAQS